MKQKEKKKEEKKEKKNAAKSYRPSDFIGCPNYRLVIPSYCLFTVGSEIAQQMVANINVWDIVLPGLVRTGSGRLTDTIWWGIILYNKTKNNNKK